MLQDRIRGSLIGGAIGDALGYPVEFDRVDEIRERYGERGITRLETKPCWNGDDMQAKAYVSDDTQMTLFTANGLLNAVRQHNAFREGICQAYLEWYITQNGGNFEGKNECWISTIPELNRRRAPGNTCMSALSDISRGMKPENDSKGCGGVMRIAPIPLYAAVDGRLDIDEADLLAGEAARLTHRHPLGYISAALMSHVIYKLALDERPSAVAMKGHILDGIATIRQLYPAHPVHVERMAELSQQAIALAEVGGDDLANIERLGQGWIGEEALAIALYCALRHFDNFEEAVISAVNHRGDSDSTGAVTGNVLGAAIGYEAIPQFYKDDVELHDVILHMADDLYRG